MTPEEKQLKKEAKELVNGFYQPLGFLRVNENTKTLWDFSKERAIKTVEHFILKMPEGSDNWLYHRKLVDEINKQ